MLGGRRNAPFLAIHCYKRNSINGLEGEEILVVYPEQYVLRADSTSAVDFIANPTDIIHIGDIHPRTRAYAVFGLSTSRIFSISSGAVFQVPRDVRGVQVIVDGPCEIRYSVQLVGDPTSTGRLRYPRPAKVKRYRSNKEERSPYSRASLPGWEDW